MKLMAVVMAQILILKTTTSAVFDLLVRFRRLISPALGHWISKVDGGG